MKISEYYNNYKNNGRYDRPLEVSQASTIQEFFDRNINGNILPKENVLAWHEMLVEYSIKDDAILWVRYYESGSKDTGRWNTRRATMTRFKDGFSYVFVSNYDAHEIWNMVRLGVEPDLDEFSEMMKTHKFPLHYDKGHSCEESDICSYPNIGNTRGGVLTKNHWYLAHINGIKEFFVRKDGGKKKIQNEEKDRLYPRGTIQDWIDDGTGFKIRKLNYSLTEEEKNLVRAHFLRFVDPLNYYAVVGRTYSHTDCCSNIGEYPQLNEFMRDKYKELYGEENVSVFSSMALIPATEASSQQADAVINISWGRQNPKKSKSAQDTTAGTGKKKGKKNSEVDDGNDGIVSPTIRVADDTDLVLIPGDISEFKCKLLLTKCAERTLVYENSEEHNIWKAKRFTENSDVMGNIKSSDYWKGRKKTGLKKVIIEVVENH